MEAPSGAHNVGWYKFGSQPGNNGTAVIAGHYGRWKNGEHSVFDNLNKLRQGDSVYVQDEEGAIAAFVVRETRMLDPKSSAKDVFASSDGRAHLNLVTCQGKWDEANKTYSNRLVVFADKL
jgi:LPXTG-site transpeptidase (sortase) family protein